ncbi:hypothetical protein MRX96_013800 [Rhipicephalus microplus]
METERATEENYADRNVPIARHCRHVEMTNMWRLRDGAVINSKGSEVFAPYLSEKTTTQKTCRLWKVISGDTIRAITSTADAVVRRHRGSWNIKADSTTGPTGGGALTGPLVRGPNDLLTKTS